MYNFDSYNVLLSISTNIPVLLMTAFVLQGHILHLSESSCMVFTSGPCGKMIFKSDKRDHIWFVCMQKH